MTIPSTAQIVDLVTDADRLSDVLDRRVHPRRLRIKPGVSMIISVTDRAGGLPAWVRFLWPVSHSKAATLRTWAGQRNLPIYQRSFGPHILIQGGDLRSDPKVGTWLEYAMHNGAVPSWEHWELLRYNPLRRVVIGQADRVVRVSDRIQPNQYELETFLARYLPIPERLDVGAEPHVSSYRRVGDRDLSTHQDLATTRMAGGLLARLHALGPRLPQTLVGVLRERTVDLVAQSEANAGILDALAPELATRIRAISRALRINDPQQVICHGDASPDQVLYSPTNEQVWLTDHERLHLGSAALDLGSYLAMTNPENAQALLDGYQESGGYLPPAESVMIAQRRSMLLRIAEPLRNADPQWRSRIAERLSTLEGEVR